MQIDYSYFFSLGTVMTRVHINVFSPQANTTTILMSHSVFTAMEITCRLYVIMN